MQQFSVVENKEIYPVDSIAELESFGELNLPKWQRDLSFVYTFLLFLGDGHEKRNDRIPNALDLFVGLLLENLRWIPNVEIFDIQIIPPKAVMVLPADAQEVLDAHIFIVHASERLEH